MKKLISYIVLVAMTVSLFAGITVFATEDITSDPMEFPINSSTVTASDGTVGAWPASFGLYNTAWLEFDINTETAKSYRFLLYGATANTNLQITVSVGGTEQISKALVPSTGSFNTSAWADLGIISLSAGSNKIRIAKMTGGAEIKIEKVKLESTNETLTHYPINNTTVTTSANNSAVAWGGSAALYVSGWIECKVNSATAKDYKMSLYGGTANTDMKIAVSVGGTEQISNFVVPSTGNANTFTWVDLGNVSLAAGENTIRIARTAYGNDHLLVTMFKLESLAEDITGEEVEFATNNTTVSLSPNTSGGGITAFAYGSCVYVYKSGWFEYTLNTVKSKTYMLSAYAGTANDNMQLAVSVNGNAQISNVVVPSTGNAETLAWANLGLITTDEGKNVIRIARTGLGDAQLKVTKLKLTLIEEEITSDPIEFATNSTTISTSPTNTSGGITAQAWGSCVYMYVDGWFEYTVKTAEAKDYMLSVHAGTANDNMQLAVSVNGNTQLSNVVVPSTGNAETLTWADLGPISLDIGTNVIRIARTATGNAQLKVTKIKLATIKEEITSIPIEFAINKDTISGTDAAEDAKYSSCVTLGAGKYLEYSIKTENEASYPLSVYCSTADDNLTMDVSVNGTVQLDDATVANNGSFATAFYDELGTITLTPGENVIRFTNVSATDAIVLRGLKIGADEEEIPDGTADFEVSSFELQTANGVRAPYVVVDGNEVYAVTELKKLTQDATDNVYLFVAQYSNDNMLINAEYITIDTSSIDYLETKKFETKITLEGETGSVKAYLMNSNDFSPLTEKLGYDEVKVFSDDVLDDVLNETTNWTYASEVSDGNGGTYAGFDEGNIKAIFYDSAVGDQSKVFAYVGVPEGATNAPAVVLVHGGHGMAYKAWVKHWNDRGVAAIAMSLGGEAPGSANSKDSGNAYTLHPYRGLDCWGEANAFKADFTAASMYQNVLNVIRAHNVIRNWEGVDETRTAITGISWGGITTTTTIGVDDRFNFAIPCYGTGYLDQSRTYFKNAYVGADRSAAWDPANFAAQADMPVLYVNGNSDPHFSLNITTHSSDVTKNSKISIHDKLIHGYEPIYGLNMIYDYALGMFEGEDPTITISDAKAEDGALTASYTAPSGTTVSSVTLYYITTLDLGYGGDVEWHSVSGTADGSTISANIPAGATHCYATVVDNNGSTISTRYLEVK